MCKLYIHLGLLHILNNKEYIWSNYYYQLQENIGLDKDHSSTIQSNRNQISNQYNNQPDLDKQHRHHHTDHKYELSCWQIILVSMLKRKQLQLSYLLDDKQHICQKQCKSCSLGDPYSMKYNVNHSIYKYKEYLIRIGIGKISCMYYY